MSHETYLVQFRRQFVFYSEVLMCCFLSVAKRPCLTKEFGANEANLQRHLSRRANSPIAPLMWLLRCNLQVSKHPFAVNIEQAPPKELMDQVFSLDLLD